MAHGIGVGISHTFVTGGYSNGTASDISTVYSASASPQRREAAWARVEQKFLKPRAGTLDCAEGADAIKEFAVYGSGETSNRATKMLRAVIAGRESGSDTLIHALAVATTVLLHSRKGAGDNDVAFIETLDALGDAIVSGKEEDALASAALRTGASIALRTVLEKCADVPAGEARAYEIVNMLSSIAAAGRHGASEVAIETLDFTMTRSQAMRNMVDVGRNSAKAKLDDGNAGTMRYKSGTSH